MRILDAADITDRLARERVHERDARIVGTLDLEGRKLDHALILEDCYVEEPILLGGTEARTIRLPGCHLWGLEAVQLNTRGDLDLREVTTTGTLIDISSARIGGSLGLSGAVLSRVDGVALRADRAVVAQNVVCVSASIRGTLRMVGADIGGRLLLDDTELFAPAATSFLGDHLVVGQDIRCTGSFESTGRFRLVGAQVGNHLTLSGAAFANWADTALDISGAAIGRDLLCGKGFSARGQVRLNEVRVHGKASFSGAELHSACDVALRAGGLEVSENLWCRSMNVRGGVDLTSARIGRSLDLGGTSIVAPGEIALDASNIEVGQDMGCAEFTARGVTSMRAARVGGSLVLSGASLVNPVGEALVAEDLSVGRTAMLNEGFEAQGTVNLVSATVPWLSLDGAKIVTDHRPALDARLVHVEQEMIIGADVDTIVLQEAQIGRLLLMFPRRPKEIDLDHAQVRLFEDDPRSWPEQIMLHGFTCDRLRDSRTPVHWRTDYLLERHAGYEPGVYDNLAAAYRRSGRVEDARQVSMAKQFHRRTELNPLGRAWNLLLLVTVGYGYRTSFAWLWLAQLLAVGTAVYWKAERAATSATVQAFNPFVYALDVLLPIVDLGQEKAWVVKGAAQYVSWGLIVAGWVLTTAVVAGLTNALKRD